MDKISPAEVKNCQGLCFKLTTSVSTSVEPSSDNLKRLSCESKSARDFRRPGLKSTSPFNSMKRIADEPLSATKTTPLVKHRSRASLNTSLRTFTSTGRCKSSSTRLSRVEIVV